MKLRFVYVTCMDAKQLKDDVRAGRIGLDRLVDLIEAMQRQLRETQRHLDEANRQIAELEKKLGPQAANKVEGAFSVEAEEKRQEARGKVKRKRKRPMRRGRVTTAEMVQRAERTEKCYPADVSESECWLSHTRPVWRLEDGRAVLVAYEIYRAPNGAYGKIRGVLGRSEFGLEIVIAISFQVHVLGLSFDKVCLLMGFFQKPVDASAGSETRAQRVSMFGKRSMFGEGLRPRGRADRRSPFLAWRRSELVRRPSVDASAGSETRAQRVSMFGEGLRPRRRADRRSPFLAWRNGLGSGVRSTRRLYQIIRRPQLGSSLQSTRSL